MAVFEYLLSFLTPQTCCGIEINTCFASPINQGHRYGGPIIIEWKKVNEPNLSPTFPQKLGIKFRIIFNDRSGRKHADEVVKTTLINSTQDTYDSIPIRKAVLLQRYTFNIKEFLIAYEKGNCQIELDRLKRFSEIFTREAIELGDSKLIQDASALDEFVKRDGFVDKQCLVQ